MKQILLTLIGVLVIFFIPHFSFLPIPFFYAIPVLLITWLLLKVNGDNFSTIGFSFRRFKPDAILAGAIIAMLLFIFLNYFFFPALNKLIRLPQTNLNDFKSVRHNPGMYIFILFMGWLIGGFYEEIVFHGFIFRRIEQMSKRKSMMIISLITTNIIFGIYHFQLGWPGMINAFIAGIVYNLVMIKFKRNLWYSIFVHGFFDTIGLTYIYLGYW
ncbi:MAG: type II CAAX endopeptidase family protein [Chitinophagaceae bacterium]